MIPVLISEAALRDTDTRRVMVRTWAIFYEIAPSHVEVVRIVHGGRDVNALRLQS